LRIASGTSRALPWPKPTLPFWSPTTTSAAKAEPPAALDDLGDAIDVNELVDELAVAIVPVSRLAFPLSRHAFVRSSDIVVGYRCVKGVRS
jgi:hypothetical protein